jgi:hypothetical protein
VRSLCVIVVYLLLKSFPDARPTDDPRVMEAVDPHFEGVKPLVDVVSITIVELTAQPESSESSQITVAIDEKHSFGETVFLSQPMNECSGWISPSPSEDRDIENQP